MKALCLAIVIATLFPTFIMSAQSDPNVPTNGYWTSTITGALGCAASDGGTEIDPAPIGYQATDPVSVSDDGKTMTVNNATLKLVKPGVYETDYVPQKPVKLPSGQQYASYTKVTVASATKFALETGTSFPGQACTPLITYDFVFLSADKPTSDSVPGPLKPGFWSTKITANSNCPQYSGGDDPNKVGTDFYAIEVDSNGVISYESYLLTKTSDTAYTLTLTYDTTPGTKTTGKVVVNLTVKSNQSLEGTTEEVYATSKGCKVTFQGKLLGEVALGKEAAARPAVDTSITLKSGTWTITYSDQKVNGNCKVDTFKPYDFSFIVSADGKEITSGSRTYERSDNGYYITQDNRGVIQVKSPESFVMESEFASGTCIVRRTSTGKFKQAAK